MVRLRHIEDADAEALYPLICDPSVTATLIWDGPASLDDFRQGLREHNGPYAFTIVEDERPVGCIDLRVDAPHRRGNIGLWIGVPAQGRGIGTEAIRQIVDYGFHQLGLERIDAHVFTGNLRSRRAFEKNGFRLEGTMRHAIWKRGKFVDEWILAVLREDR